MKGYFKVIAVVCVCMLLGMLLHKCSDSGQWTVDSGQWAVDSGGVIVVDTVRVYDTIVYYEPLARLDRFIGYLPYRLPYSAVDSGRRAEGMGAGGMPRQCDGEIQDSIEVELPVVERYYEDSLYEAWVSGPVDPRLDSLKIYSRTEYITKYATLRERDPPKRWHIGITAGYAATPKGFQPYVGMGVTYSILSW